MSSVDIQVFHDFACPWSRIAEANLRTALVSLGFDSSAVVTYHPFELNPGLPRNGVNRAAYLAREHGSAMHAQRRDADAERAGRRIGLAFDFDRLTLLPATLPAHQLMDFAVADGPGELAMALATSIHDAYFVHSLDIGDHDVLVEIGARHGLSPHTTATFLASGAGVDAVRTARQRAREDGIKVVPTVVVGSTHIPGAQPPGIFARALRDAALTAPQPPLPEGV
ncbi:DsbA family oxidoreductase [Burkholderia metallica]|uniref:DsbA family oxidoreductase n=1 Tax=Burkholderia metallica TaxID=488729 RepID=UPI00157B1CF0|nr:DsbA family oxidoreductase [Burkholderia metallica]NTZ86835.1 DsbA family oxidoreductase [Burkholderia metallica]